MQSPLIFSYLRLTVQVKYITRERFVIALERQLRDVGKDQALV
jgi:hypothetical protein